MNKLSIFFFALAFLCTGKVKAQIGINNPAPKSTLDVKPDNQANPSGISGVIIPRVNALNTTDVKEKGLMVFLNSADAAQKGFYWWNGTEWKRFLSLSRVSSNKSILYATTKNIFKEGNMTELGSSNDRTLDFEDFTTNDASNFEINTSGELVVKKAGYYHIQAASFIKKNNGNDLKREQLDMKIYVNGVTASANNPVNFDLEGTKSFPIGLYSIAINATGVLKLNANDRLSMKIIRTYRDTDQTGNLVIIPDQNTKSNVTLRYMGNF